MENKAKLNFGKYAVLREVTYKFKEEPDWWWLIKPATSNEEIIIQQCVLMNRKYYESQDENGDTIKVPLPPTAGEIAVYEVTVTFGGTNIPSDDDENKPVLTKDASFPDIIEFVRSLPGDMLHELWVAVGQSNPTMGPRKDPF